MWRGICYGPVLGIRSSIPDDPKTMESGEHHVTKIIKRKCVCYKWQKLFFYFGVTSTNLSFINDHQFLCSKCIRDNEEILKMI